MDDDLWNDVDLTLRSLNQENTSDLVLFPVRNLNHNLIHLGMKKNSQVCLYCHSNFKQPFLLGRYRNDCFVLWNVFHKTKQLSLWCPKKKCSSKLFAFSCHYLLFPVYHKSNLMIAISEYEPKCGTPSAVLFVCKRWVL